MNQARLRVRRPTDLARLLVALAIGALVFAAGYLAAQTTTALQSDIVQATRLLPNLLIALLTGLSGTLAVLLPAILVMVGLIERKIRLVLEAHLAAVIAITAAILANNYISNFASIEIVAMFVGSSLTSTTTAINALLAGTMALAVVLRFTERKYWSGATISIIALLAWSTVLAGSATLVAQLLSLIGGIISGLLVRILLGTPSTRPTLTEIVQEIAEFEITESNLIELSPTRYLATLKSGEPVTLEILDRDLDQYGFLSRIWRAVRLRGIESGAGLAMRDKAERLMLANLAVRNVDIKTGEIYAVKEINSDAIVILRQTIKAADITVNTTNLSQVITEVWQQLATLHRSDIAHRHATLDSFKLDSGHIVVTNLDSAVIAAPKLLMALDVAELLLATSQLIGPKAAVEIAANCLGKEQVFYAARLLQPIAMSATSRANLRAHKSSLAELRAELANLGFDTNAEVLNLERLKPRTLIFLTITVAAGYAILNQLGSVNLINLFTTADTSWILIAIGFSLLTYLGATVAISAFITNGINWFKTLTAQLAGSFITLVTPPAVGAVSVNLRFLQKNGVSPAAAGATVAMSQVTMFGTHLLMLLIISVIAGTTAELSFDPPRWVVLGITLLAFCLILLLTIPLGRNWLVQVTAKIRNQAAPAMVKVFSEPKRLLAATAGAVVMNLSYILCLAAVIRSFGDSTDLITVAFIYLAGATLGSLAPTPGGLGAVEAVLVAALTAGGLPAATAISVTLVYRLVTFWLPVIPGWIGFNYLSRTKSL